MDGAQGRELTRWIVAVDGFDEHAVYAVTASKARYRAYKDAEDAGFFIGRDGFARFIVRSRVWRG